MAESGGNEEDYARTGDGLVGSREALTIIQRKFNTFEEILVGCLSKP